MDDTLICPICNNKLTNLHYKRTYLAMLNKKSHFIQRTCAKGYSHSFQIITDGYTHKVDWIKLSLTPNYSRWLEINYSTNECIISCVKNGYSERITLDRQLEPDFPSLAKLKEKVSLFIVFS